MGNIRKAFREEVADLTWIDSDTKPKVYEKVQFFNNKNLCVLPFVSSNWAIHIALRTDASTT